MTGRRGGGWLRLATSSACSPAGVSPWLDLNPVIATPEGALVVDARVRLEATGPAPAFPSLNA